VFVLRDDRNALHAMHDRCSHRGCSLADGSIEGDTVVCACHGSAFRLADGSVARGPATAGQPSYEVRDSGGGRIEIRLPG
jgi:nitrite reductase/ring-hydroxylating ferredoxin subunit